MFPIRAVEDDHVDRPGVEVRQRMKLTGTNSSIGLIVLIDYAHHPANTKCLSGSMIQTFCPDAVAALPLRSGRAAPRGATAAWPCGASLRRPHEGRRVQIKETKDVKTSASFSHKLRFADLVVMAGWLHPFPFRTRP